MNTCSPARVRFKSVATEHGLETEIDETANLIMTLPGSEPDRPFIACGRAGMFTAINTMSCLARVFEEKEALDRPEGFTSLHGPAFYRLSANEARIRLEKSEKALNFPQKVAIGSGPVTVFDPGFRLFWRVEEDVTRELDSSKLSDNKDGLDVSARIP